MVEYLAFIPRFGLVVNTVSRAAPKLLALTILYLVVLFGFIQAFMLAFGRVSLHYRDLAAASLTLLRAIFKDADFSELRVHNSVGKAPSRRCYFCPAVSSSFLSCGIPSGDPAVLPLPGVFGPRGLQRRGGHRH